jgi:hypothetical protein
MSLGELDQFAVVGDDAALMNEPAELRVRRWSLGARNEDRIFDDRYLRGARPNSDFLQRFVNSQHQIVKSTK